MEHVRGFDDDRSGPPGDGSGRDGADDVVIETRPKIGGDERRMHVRAYNYWVSLLDGQPVPSITCLEPASIADFGAHSVLLDFSHGETDPGVAYLGRALREECGIERNVERISDVPGRSLLSRLTDHYRQILANRAPVGFEAEFVGSRGHTMMYRGILMPFSSDGTTIDYIYGVINWKELVGEALQARLQQDVDAALRAAPPPAPAPTAWADGPGAIDGDPVMPLSGALDAQLDAARVAVAEADDAEARSRSARHAALGRAHDFALAAAADPAGCAALLDAAGIDVHAERPLIAVAKLIFGADSPETRLTEAATALAHAERVGVAAGTFAQYLAATEGGLSGIVAAERGA